MPRLDESRLALRESLNKHYGTIPWPGGGLVAEPDADPFESIVATALGLVTDARTASAAFVALRDAGLLLPAALASANPLELDDIFQQARVRLASKALKPLQRVARWASDSGFSAATTERLSTEAIREAWRNLNGVGPATTDSLLLFALGRPTYPVDRASYRILIRHGWLDPTSDYDEARATLEGMAVDEPEALAQLSLAFEKLGRDTCKLAKPQCDRCPLQGLLPEGGPVALEE